MTTRTRLTSLRLARLGRKRLSTSPATTTPSSTPSRSAFELDEAPLFSLRTRMLFYTTVGSAVLGSIASYWLSANRENAYWAQDMFPQAMKLLGPYLGVPIDPKTGMIDRDILGARDVRDLVGDRVQIDVVLKSGMSARVEADALEQLSSVSIRLFGNDAPKEIDDVRTKSSV